MPGVGQGRKTHFFFSVALCTCVGVCQSNGRYIVYYDSTILNIVATMQRGTVVSRDGRRQGLCVLGEILQMRNKM